ncbi:hypothetical protein C8F04DRAFT_89732 [Mycena alexandri]|uniref:Uncharacterized protein n=1 Tax=Mycena alexandri TaxID=1745969 RepID=A0AAD6SHZ4_9AGAR|nr:hypothetical protein C8F04DRAFT_89732 [Mycena alexandri]
MSTNDDKKLNKAKAIFLKHLKEVDTSQGPVNQVILKFRLVHAPLFDVFVKHHGCTMSTRIISREEQDAVDARQKNCAQYTSVLVTSEAQAKFLERKNEITEVKNAGRLIAEAYTSISSKVELNPSGAGLRNSDSSANPALEVNDEKLVLIPSAKYDSFSARLAKAIQQLPTTDPFQGRKVRSELIDIGHELRWFRPTKVKGLALQRMEE